MSEVKTFTREFNIGENIVHINYMGILNKELDEKLLEESLNKLFKIKQSKLKESDIVRTIRTILDGDERLLEIEVKFEDKKEFDVDYTFGELTKCNFSFYTKENDKIIIKYNDGKYSNSFEGNSKNYTREIFDIIEFNNKKIEYLRNESSKYVVIEVTQELAHYYKLFYDKDLNFLNENSEYEVIKMLELINIFKNNLNEEISFDVTKVLTDVIDDYNVLELKENILSLAKRNIALGNILDCDNEYKLSFKLECLIVNIKNSLVKNNIEVNNIDLKDFNQFVSGWLNNTRNSYKVGDINYSSSVRGFDNEHKNMMEDIYSRVKK